MNVCTAMIEGHEKFRLPDKSGKDKHLLIEVNWKPDDEKTNRCQVLKLTYPDGTEAFIDKSHFHAIMFAIGNPEEQTKLIPQKVETVHWRKTVLGIKALKDIRKGEMINFPIEISFPCGLAKEIIGEAKRSANKGLLLPNETKKREK